MTRSTAAWWSPGPAATLKKCLTLRAFEKCLTLFRGLVSAAIYVALAVGAPVALAAEAPAPRRGALVLAHGGSRSWDRTVRRTVRAAHLGIPTQIAFGMGFHRSEAETLQRAVSHLEAEGVQEIVVVPLFVSSASEVFRQLEYLLGRRAEAAVHHEPLQPVTTRAAIRITPPLEDDPVVVEIVTAQARELSRAPAGETLLLVAHGPNEDADNAQWLACMERIAQAARQRVGFHRAVPITLRDDAEDHVKAAATAQLRAAVAEAARDSEVLIVPLLIARGGIESGIPKRLRGLQYRYSGATLLPDERIAQWLRKRALER